MAQLSKLEAARQRLDMLRELEREAKREYETLIRRANHKARLKRIHGPPAPKGRE